MSMCGAVTGLVVSVALTVLMPNELRGLCIGAFIAIAGLIGFGLAPWVVDASQRVDGRRGDACGGVGARRRDRQRTVFPRVLLAMKRAPEPIR
jgi:hypothetical protein